MLLTEGLVVAYERKKHEAEREEHEETDVRPLLGEVRRHLQEPPGREDDPARPEQAVAERDVDEGGNSDDDMYDNAVYIVTTTRNASISWVQRQLRIGYNRAARLVEEMEKQGVVSPPDHTNKREVLVAT